MWIRRLGIRKRLFFAYSAMAFVSVCLFLIVLVVVITRTSFDIERANMEETVGSSAKQIESVLREMDMLALQISTRTELINSFVPLATDGDPSNFYETNLLESIDTRSLITTMSTGQASVARVSVYNLNGDYISAGMLFDTPEAIAEVLSDQKRIQNQFDYFLQRQSEPLVLDPDLDHWSSSQKNHLFSVIRPMTNAYASQIFGLVSVQYDATVLESLLGSREDIYLFDASGNNLLPRTSMEVDIAAVYELAASEKKGTGNESQWLVSSRNVDMTDWLLVCARPQQQAYGLYADALVALISGGIVLLLTLMLTVYLLAKQITRPLETFSDAIGRVNFSNMDIAIPETQTMAPELITLNVAFQSMLGRLSESMDLEMKAYQYALQSQMNPHFLYNTLAVINAMALERGDFQMSSMCDKLSAMLRYLMNYENELVPLADELTHVCNYLDLMKLRYEDGFSYEIERHEGMERILVPKMILQPLAENCFQHGFSNVRPPWHIKIFVSFDGHHWMLGVEDNGSGISQEEIDALQSRISEYRKNLASNYPQLKLGGMGLINTILRLSLRSDRPVSYNIHNKPTGGTIITIGGEVHDPGTDR